MSGTAPGKTIISLHKGTRERLAAVQKAMAKSPGWGFRLPPTADEAVAWLIDEHERVSRETEGAGR